MMVKFIAPLALQRLVCAAVLAVLAFVAAPAARAETIVWRGPTQTLTLGLTEDDIAHVEFPEPISNITVENQDYVDILVVDGYGNRAFRMRSLLPKMATRTFFTGESGSTYIVVLTTDVPYDAFVQIVDGKKIDDIARKVAKEFGPSDLVRAMALDADIPGVLRETFVIPNWFRGAGLTFDLAEVWQSATLTGLVVNVRNLLPAANEVNMPVITIPRTDEWGTLRYSAMENMRMEPAGRPGDQGVMFLVFTR